MPSILIAYATREGHTSRIAEHLKRHLCASAEPTAVTLWDCASAEAIDLTCYSAVFLAASVHNRRHEPEAERFARRLAAAGSGIATAFVSVSSAQMLAESPHASARVRALAGRGARELIERFLDATGLRPAATLSVSGALRYTDYRPLLRLVFSVFARLGGLSTDTTRDHVYTDWLALTHFADQFVAQLKAAADANVSAR